MHDRAQRQPAYAIVAGSRESIGCLHHTSHGRQRLNALMLEDVSRGNEQPGFARFGHQLDGADAVTPQLKEVVLNTHPREAKDLGKEPAEDLFLGSAWGAVC